MSVNHQSRSFTSKPHDWECRKTQTKVGWMLGTVSLKWDASAVGNLVGPSVLLAEDRRMEEWWALWHKSCDLWHFLIYCALTSSKAIGWASAVVLSIITWKDGTKAKIWHHFPLVKVEMVIHSNLCLLLCFCLHLQNTAYFLSEKTWLDKVPA